MTESVQWTGGKQRLTATRLHELLVADGYRVGVTVVKMAVAEWKRQRREVFDLPALLRHQVCDAFIAAWCSNPFRQIKRINFCSSGHPRICSSATAAGR